MENREQTNKFEIRNGKHFHPQTGTYHERSFNDIPPVYWEECEEFPSAFHVFSTQDSVSRDPKIYYMLNEKYRGFLLRIIYVCVQNMKTAEYYNNLRSSLHKYFQERHLSKLVYSSHIQNIIDYALKLNQIMDTSCDTPCEKESLLNETKEALESYCLNMKFNLSHD